MNLETTNDIFDMSDAEFTNQYGTSDSGSLVQTIVEDSTDVGSSTLESDESTIIDESQDYEDDIESEESEELVDDINTDIDTESADLVEEEQEVNTPKFEDEYNKLIGIPIKGAGREITLQSADEALRLIQMGMGYHKKMEQLKPQQKLISMLQSNGMLDETKLSYAIDLLNGNQQAISKLISESGIDTYSVDEEEVKNYKPTVQSVSDQDQALDNALNDISGSSTYAQTVNTIGTEWDDKSREIIRNNPAAIGVINSHMESGLFETVSNEVERFKMLGKLPSGISDFEAYKYVGDYLYAQPQTQSAPVTGQQNVFDEAPIKSPIKKPNREAVIKRKKSTGSLAGSPSRRTQVVDVFDMDDNDFIKQYGLNLN